MDSNNPYISANPLSVDVWKNIIKSDKIKVGIRWSGSPLFEHQQFRIFPPEPLIDLHKYKEVQFYSLQRDTDTRELPEEIIDLQHLIISWEDTAAAIMNLDLVITSCTSIAHLAGALGKRTWVISPILPFMPTKEVSEYKYPPPIIKLIFSPPRCNAGIFEKGIGIGLKLSLFAKTLLLLSGIIEPFNLTTQLLSFIVIETTLDAIDINGAEET